MSQRLVISPLERTEYGASREAREGLDAVKTVAPAMAMIK